jgi:uncharacterized protein YlzI (FlbEa/FlbD family)
MFVKLTMLNGNPILVSTDHVAAIGMDGDGDTVIKIGDKETVLRGSMDDAVNAIDQAYDRLSRFEAIAAESDGVAGYHMNGEVATWAELGL